MVGGQDLAPPGRVGRGSASGSLRLKRLSLAAATAFVAINIWTGAPLFALWVGSKVVGQSRLRMGAVVVVVIVLAVVECMLTLTLIWLGATYDRLVGRPRVEQRFAWLRSMRAEGGKERISHAVGVTALERIVMVSVYVAVIALLLWFVFLAGSPLPR